MFLKMGSISTMRSGVSNKRCLQLLTNYSTQTAKTPTEQIIIPNRIERSSTDILRALGSIIKPDPTAAHFKYHDDPYLIPKSNMGKRTFAMAQEAGRKAAVWVKQQHPNLFEQALADPPVKAFGPKMTFDETCEVNEDILNEVIEDVQVTDAITVYNLLESKGVQVSDESKQALLELLCYYNCEDVLEEEWIEERWFTQDVKGTANRMRKTWKDNSLAESLFKSLPANSASYSTIIQGMAKHCQVDKAWDYFQQAEKENIPLTLEVYNALIKVAMFTRDANDLRWSFIQEMLIRINQAKLKPNLSTLNAMLFSISNLTGSRKVKSYILNTIAEFKKLKIEPSLASWYYVLLALCNNRGPKSGVLYDIMNQIDGKEFQIRDVKDTHFFVTAMDVCRNHLQDINLGRRVNELLQTGNNYDLIGDSYKESVYYRHLFALMCKTEPLEVFMEFYDNLVPNIYTPEPGVMIELLRAIEINNAIELIPRIWSDMIMFDHNDRENLITLVLQIIVQANLTIDSPDLEKYVKVAWDIYTNIEEQPEHRTKRLHFTGDILGNIIHICSIANDFEKADKAMQSLLQGNVLQTPNIEALEQFLNLCIINKMPSKAIALIQYAADVGHTESGLMARKLTQKLTLNEDDLKRLVNIVGEHILKVQTDEKNQNVS